MSLEPQEIALTKDHLVPFFPHARNERFAGEDVARKPSFDVFELSIGLEYVLSCYAKEGEAMTLVG